MPSILFIHAESMDGRTMGCMGHPAMREATPSLDRLAGRGVLFRKAYTTCPVCNPSRASMWTGKYPSAYDCWNNFAGLEEGTPILWDVLKSAGYRVTNFGKTDFEKEKHSVRDRVGSWTRRANIERPINRLPLPKVVEGDPHAADHAKCDAVIDEMKAAAANSQPFFCCLSTALAHAPFVTQQRYLDRIDPALVEVPPGLRDISGEDHPADRYTRIAKGHRDKISEELALEIRRVYYAMIAELDDIVGRLAAAVEELGLSDSTYIIFSSDHGEMACEHNQTLKRSFYEPSARVPLIITGPGVRKGAVFDEPVSLIDIYPTILDMAGLDYASFATDDRWPKQLDGESLVPQLQHGHQRKRDWAFGEYHGDRCLSGAYMLRRGKWKFIYYVDYPPQLFDLEGDPWELNNLAEEQPAVVREMEAILRSRFDLEGIEQRARRSDARNFRRWREEQQRLGTYQQTMARIFSGFDCLCIGDVKPWTAADEAQVEDWLARSEYRS